MTIEDDSDLAGTANGVHQHRLYRDLAKIYSPEGANHIASASLKRHGVDVPPEGIAWWHKVQMAAYADKMDLAAEANIAAAGVNAFTDAMIGRNQTTPSLAEKALASTVARIRSHYAEQGKKLFSTDSED